MNNEVMTQQDEDRIDLSFLWHFIRRQRLFFVKAFFLIVALIILYAIVRPVSWESRVSIYMGERLFFQTQPMESPEEIRYVYSKEVVVVPTNVVVNSIRNTRFIEIKVTEKSKSLAIAKIKKTMNEIIARHRRVLDYKKTEFVNILNTINKGNIDQTELMRLLDSASSSVLTRQATEIITEEETYGLSFFKIIGNGFLFGILITIVLAAIKDYMGRKTKRA